jgi:DNA-binding Lrp family transcriptional regulator
MRLVVATEHSAKWLDQFSKAVRDIPGIVGVYRMTGDVDYLLQALIPDVAAYDKLYKRLIGRITLADVSSSFCDGRDQGNDSAAARLRAGAGNSIGHLRCRPALRWIFLLL